MFYLLWNDRKRGRFTANKMPPFHKIRQEIYFMRHLHSVKSKRLFVNYIRTPPYFLMKTFYDVKLFEPIQNEMFSERLNKVFWSFKAFGSDYLAFALSYVFCFVYGFENLKCKCRGNRHFHFELEYAFQTKSRTGKERKRKCRNLGNRIGFNTLTES